jgi:hypothetical protein
VGCNFSLEYLGYGSLVFELGFVYMAMLVNVSNPLIVIIIAFALLGFHGVSGLGV